jgi:hypothetical protein
MTSIQLSDPAGRGWVNVRAGDIWARGQLQPRLEMTLFAATTREKRWADVHLLRGKLSFNNEQIAEGLLSGVSLNHVERSLTLEMLIDRAALQYVTDNAVGDRIDLTLDLTGWMQVYRELTDDDPTYLGETPAPGEKGFIAFGQGSQARLQLQVARSDWFTQVMQPVGTLNYLVTEIPLPKGDAATAFLAPLNHLKEAERRYAAGDDAEVFFRCRAALEAMPGAPQNIFDGLPDHDLAESMNAVMKETVDYLHRGRHPQREGDQRGEFAVDHGDAQFALAITRLLVAQAARLLSKGVS